MNRSFSANKVIPFLLSFLILYLVFRKISYGQVLLGIEHASVLWLAVYFALATLEPVIRGVRWHLLLRRGSISRAVKGLYIAKAGNNVLPLRLGDIIRSQYVKDFDGVPYSTSLPSIFSEIFLDLASLAIISVIYSLFDRKYSSFSFILVSILLLVAVSLFVLNKSGIVNRYRGSKRPVLFVRKMLLSVFFSFSSKSIIPTVALTFFLWCYTIFMSYAGLKIILPSVTIPGVLATIVFTYLTATIPSAPGFIGTYHAAVAAGMLAMGYSLTEYPAVPILIHLAQYIPQTLVGVVIGFSYLLRNDWVKVRHSLMKNYSEEIQ